MSRFSIIKRFKDFHLNESLNEDSTLGPSKAEEYRSIAYKLSEIFGLYGFFFGLNPGFFDDKNWPKLMNEIILVKDPAQRWDKILRLSKFLQSKLSSPEMAPKKRGDFGFIGDYDYGNETKDLPTATQFLKNASDALMKTFTSDEKAKALAIMDQVLKKMKPITITSPSSVQEARKTEPMQDTDLLLYADTIGTKLLNIGSALNNIRISYPKSASKIDSFFQSSIEPAVEKVRRAIDEEIPKVTPVAREGYFKKLQIMDKNADSLSVQSKSLKDSIVSEFQPSAASKEFENSAQSIIDKIRTRILGQAQINARTVKSGEVVAGTVDVSDPTYSGDPRAKSSKDKEAQKKKSTYDLADFLVKKYQLRK